MSTASTSYIVHSLVSCTLLALLLAGLFLYLKDNSDPSPLRDLGAVLGRAHPSLVAGSGVLVGALLGALAAAFLLGRR